MKRFVWMVALMSALAGHSLTAQENKSTPDLEYKKHGFYLGTELAGLIGSDGSSVIGAPGKIDFLAGYQINPYISVGADLWTFLFLAYAAEAHVKANFTDAKISPYAVATVGVISVINFDDDGNGKNPVGVTYSAGLGADFHLWKKTTLFTEVKYRGGTGLDGLFSTLRHGAEIGAGFRWTF